VQRESKIRSQISVARYLLWFTDAYIKIEVALKNYYVVY
jgi:hypothetical protein